MDVVFATKTAVVSDPQTGAGRSINAGEHWAADDPVVKAYPSFFADDPRYGLSSSRPLADDGYPVIEQTTAAPGEKRTRGKAAK